MAQESLQLNLARKWRSKQFDAVVGQELPVRILQNSLYVNQFFPVYLFSGQRGCGKTTTARLFAGAVNCHNLELFQKDPKQYKVPCLTCSSCIAMAAASHPDFIEIDAASYTGVDNIRSIIESASLLPVLGRKKVYLIDEAHMLSKAAFNAFLKILEEPPATVLFMLATTDPHKIIETVKSRCFQLFFTSIATPVMTAHLQKVCEKEEIAFEQSALQVIASETQGSARDALNLLEQVRFSHSAVTLPAVGAVLGHMPEQELLALFDALIEGDLSALVQKIQNSLGHQYVVLTVWKKTAEVVRAILFLKQGVPVDHSFQDRTKMSFYAAHLTVDVLIRWLRVIYSYEQLLLKSTVQHALLEALFIDLLSSAEQAQTLVRERQPVVAKQVLNSDLPVASTEEKQVQQIDQCVDARWQKFIDQAQQLSDPLLQSIFKQAQYKEFVQDTGQVVVMFARESTFFASWIADTKQLWEGYLQQAFGQNAVLQLLFEGAKQDIVASRSAYTSSSAQVPVKKVEPVVQSRSSSGSQKVYKTPKASVQEIKKELLVDISDTEKWQKAHLLKEVFGGAVVEVPEDEGHEQTEL